MRFGRIPLLAALLVGVHARADAQCPDGSEPPRGRPCGVPARPLDDKVWIVLPFTNAARAPDVEWIRDASVNLLYLELSRFSDFRVVDDERVASLTRGSGARGGSGPTLEEGLALARREGAGRLVLGDLIKSGGSMTVIAKVYDVRRRSRLRSIRHETTADSVFEVFGRVADDILGLARTQRRGRANLGTSSLGAYQSYLEGVKALNSVNLREARGHFDRALELDSAFALAHHKLSLVGLWESATGPGVLAHAEAAVRFAERLPPRERKLIAAQRQLAAADVSRACAGYRELVAADSSDAEAQFGLGECEFRDGGVLPASADSSSWRFRSSWNVALRAYLRVLELEPANHLAFRRAMGVLVSGIRVGCPVTGLPGYCVTQRAAFAAAVDRVGDSLITIPIPATSAGGMAPAMAAARRSGSRRRNLEEALRIARQWSAAGPQEVTARLQVAYVLQSLGRFDEADAELRTVGTNLQPIDAMTMINLRAFSALRRGDAASFADAVDSLQAVRNRGRVQVDGLRLSAMSPMTGRMAYTDTVNRGMTELPLPLLGYLREVILVALGVRDDVGTLEQSAAPLLAAVGADDEAAATFLAPTLRFGLLSRRSSWPAFLTRSTHPRLGAAIAVARGDTAALRREALRLDSAGVDAFDPGDPVVAIDVYILLGDSATALARARALDSAGTLVLWNVVTESTIPSPILVPRVWLRRGDLAAELGFRDEAREAYGRWLALWARADPEFAPVVARVRAAYQRLQP